jgi:hypothetical protein
VNVGATNVQFFDASISRERKYERVVKMNFVVSHVMIVVCQVKSNFTSTVLPTLQKDPT